MSRITTEAQAHAAHERATLDRVKLGFWIYLMTDLMLFAALFATYIVLRPGIADGPRPADIFEMPYVLVETLLLLTSSFTSGLAILALRAGNKYGTICLLLITALLGAGFLGMELHEFAKLAGEGYDWTRSAFLSSFFTLVGTHGAHITVGLIWVTTLMVRLARRGITSQLTRQGELFSLFWHFLDIVWIFVFTIVYLMGVA